MGDYGALLKKYMAHVGDEEGSTFVDYLEVYGFTPEEAAELVRINEEINAERRAAQTAVTSKRGEPGRTVD